MKRTHKPPPPRLHAERVFLVRVSLPADWSEAEAARAVEQAARDLQRSVYVHVGREGRPAPATAKAAD